MSRQQFRVLILAPTHARNWKQKEAKRNRPGLNKKMMLCCLSISCWNHPTCHISDTSSVSRQQQPQLCSVWNTNTDMAVAPEISQSASVSLLKKAQFSSSRFWSTSKAVQKQCCCWGLPRAGAMSLNISSSSKLGHPSRAKDFTVRLERPKITILVRCTWPLRRNSGLVLVLQGLHTQQGTKIQQCQPWSSPFNYTRGVWNSEP